MSCTFPPVTAVKYLKLNQDSSKQLYFQQEDHALQKNLISQCDGVKRKHINIRITSQNFKSPTNNHVAPVELENINKSSKDEFSNNSCVDKNINLFDQCRRTRRCVLFRDMETDLFNSDCFEQYDYGTNATDSYETHCKFSRLLIALMIYIIFILVQGFLNMISWMKELD